MLETDVNGIRKGAVRSAKVKDGSLLATDFRSGQLPAGPKGETGPRGPKGDPGQPGSARAYALVDPKGAQNGVDPAFVQSYTNGFNSVRRIGTGSYCVQVRAGIDPARTPAMVNAEFGPSGGAVLNAYWQDGDSCHSDEYQVATALGGAFSNDVAFTILAP